MSRKSDALRAYANLCRERESAARALASRIEPTANAATRAAYSKYIAELATETERAESAAWSAMEVANG